MDTNNSWKLATDKGLPHSVVVAKLKKYRRWADRPLMLFREGTYEGGIIYSFDTKHYDDCCFKERKAVVKRKKIQAENAMIRLHGKKK
jgi:hypothetical protein